MVMLCANLASTFGGSERQVAVSSTDGSATGNSNLYSYLIVLLHAEC